MRPPSKVVFLFDVDNTLLDNDRIIHKEEMLNEVKHHYPARDYVVVDDKLRILAAVKEVWGKRVTTVWPCQGHYALDSQATAMYPAADLAIDRIGDLVHCDLRALMSLRKP